MKFPSSIRDSKRVLLGFVMTFALALPALTQAVIWFAPVVAVLFFAVLLLPFFLLGRRWWRRSPMRGRQILGRLLLWLGRMWQLIRYRIGNWRR